MDEVDVAWNFTEAFLKAAINKTKQSQRRSRETCLECGEEIPEARRDAVPGCELCVTCQRELEAMR